MMSFKVTPQGAFAVFILTKETMAHMRGKNGDIISLTQTPNGGLRLTPYDPDFERQMPLT
ncbi:hypothetical protein [Asticcacaulis excentricus]|uniref:Uncharacterized protein n=1 Tax=Asticcacaulis excentricus (strain ATCC 15261 / DSM 4724 / KCTC 12464 / NCIMB 9791 / VKM B-1370 / CB 48) TaxID=573065 RepID=E8RNH8_ASTEC|nr:hypothetical protein [Asticcacaulis excentricus]ADU11809.1 hypothetical protein Astex_0107 [Asticcacaulis excentricus CB 48]